ncbi:MAG TPA: hypothetical protein VL993_12270 [Stellaceae bacterium]|nr:hypothetical protein [Stellaceae bacterium]
MPNWRSLGEPSLDELLSDEIMQYVLRAAGLDAVEFRRRLKEMSKRLGDRARVCASSRGPAFC